MYDSNRFNLLKISIMVIIAILSYHFQEVLTGALLSLSRIQYIYGKGSY